MPAKQATDYPALLTMPTYGGTLAAVRCFGEHGIPVTMVGDDGPLAPARWSRHVTRWVKSPSVLDEERFLDWLLEFGRRYPGHFLYPTCDDLAWLFAEHARELGEVFRLYQPPVEAMLRLLDKRALYELAVELGMAILPTAFAETEAQAAEVASGVGFPMLLKPRTQVYLRTRSKGDFVERVDDIPRAYESFLWSNKFHPRLRQIVPGIERPMLQAFRPDAAQNIYSVSGFFGRGRSVARAAVKVLQRPRRLGVGLCFEEAPVDREALDGLTRLFEAVGYFGVFEAEFVREKGRLHLIDLNPRFYGQMGFETARDLPLPYLVWLGALGRNEELDEELERAAAWQEGLGYVYCNRFFFGMMLSLQRLSGWVSAEELSRWQRWLREPTEKALAFDSLDAPDDHAPGVVGAVRDVYWAMRHPRSFYRQMIVGP